MFNHEAYNARLATIRTLVHLAVDDMDQATFIEWQKDVALRYARFLANRSLEQMQRAVHAFGGYDLVEDKQKHREYCAGELMGVVAGIHAASAMMRGAVVCGDAVGAEAMMRIYEEANPAKSDGQSAPAVEVAGPASQPRDSA